MKDQSTIKTLSDADNVLFDLASIEIFISNEENEMNEEMKAIEKKFAARIKSSQDKRLILENNLRLFVQQNKKLFEGKKKIVKLIFGRLGIKATKPAIKLLNKKHKWETALHLVKAMFGKKYLREKEELNKEALLAAATGKSKLVSDQDLASCGLQVDQGDDFYYKVDLKKVEESSQSSAVSKNQSFE